MPQQESTLRVGVDSGPMVSGARKGEKALEGLGKAGRGVGKTFDTLSSRTNVLRGAFAALVAVGVVSFFNKVLKAADDFETKMAEISTLVDATTFKLGKLEAAILKQSTAFGSPALEQAAASYQIISAGASTATEAMELLTAANMLAVGGVTDVATAADGLTSVLNAYGDKVESAAAVSDALFVGMRAGKTTIGELSNSLGKVAPLAAQVGVSFDSLVASVAALTKGGINTRIAVTGVRAILAAVVKPTKEAADESSRLGLQFNSTALKAKGFAEFMKDVVTATGGSSDSLAKLFGGVEALIPAMALAGQAGVDFTAILKDMETKSGATREAFEKFTNTSDFQAARLKANLNVAFIQLGTILSQIITPAIKFLNDNFEALKRFVIVAAAGFAAVFSPAIAAAGVAVVAFTGKLVLMAAAFALTPFGLITTLILGAAAALAYFGDTTVEVGGKQTTVWGAFIALLQVAWDWVKVGIDILTELFGTGVEEGSKFFDATSDGLLGFFEDWRDTIMAVTGGIKDGINIWIGLHFAFVKSIGTVITEGIPASFKLAMALAKNVVIDGLEGISNLFLAQFGLAGDALSLLPGFDDNLGDQIREALNVDLSEFRTDTGALISEVKAVGSKIGAVFEEELSRDFIGEVGDGLAALGESLEEQMAAKIEVASEAAKKLKTDTVTLTETINGGLIPASEGAAAATKKVKDEMEELARIRERFIEGIDSEYNRILTATGHAQEVTREWYQEQLEQLRTLGLEYTEYANKLDVIFNDRMQKAYRTDLDNATDWRSGIDRAVLDLGESVGTEADLAGTALTSLFDGAATAIVDFATTGKANFKDFARSMAADILMITTRMLLLKALKTAIGGFSEGGEVGDGGIGSILGLASGGSVRGPGTGKSDSIPAMLSDGEYVVNAAATKQFGPLLEAINSGNMEMVGLATGGLSNEAAIMPAIPQREESKAPDAPAAAGGGNITIIPSIGPSDIANSFDSDEGSKVMVNMMERNRTQIKRILS